MYISAEKKERTHTTELTFIDIFLLNSFLLFADFIQYIAFFMYLLDSKDGAHLT